MDIVKALGGKFYGMTQAEISAALNIKSGGTLSALLSNLIESGIVREYPRYGKQRVETVYQLKDFFSLFYLRFIDGHQTSKGKWNTLQGLPVFYAWAGESFELLCTEHLPQIQDALRLPSIDRNYCWSGKGDDGKGAQIDLVLECRTARTDYICEMKFSRNKYSVSQDDADNFQNKIAAFQSSKMYDKTHSIQFVLVTTMGMSNGEHASIVNRIVTMDDIFRT